MRLSHHLDEATLLAYAAATLPAALQITAASHIAWCRTCRERSRTARMIGAEIIDNGQPAEVSGDCLTQTLARLQAAPVSAAKPDGNNDADELGLPGPLAGVLGHKSFDEIKWRRAGFGIHLYDIGLDNADDGRLFLLRVAPGKAVPEHGHGGDELTLVLRGAYEDETGSYHIGDIADLDHDVEHKPVVMGQADCICLVALEKPARFKSLGARLLQPFIGI